jgi:signal transduction histidine kinase
LLFDSGPALQVLLSPDFTIVPVSDAHLKATMRRREDVVGRNLFDVFPENPDDAASASEKSLLASLMRVKTTLTADTMPILQYDIRRPEAEGGGYEQRFWTPINSPILDASGGLAHILNRVEDITEFVRLQRRDHERSQQTAALRTKAERMEAEVFLRSQEVAEAHRQLQVAHAEMERLYAKARELDAAKSQFFAGVSHDLRTPLTLIIAPTERLLSDPALSAPMRATLEMVTRNARLLLHQVNDLLDASRLEAGKMGLVYADADFSRIMRVVAGHFDSLASEKGIIYRLDLADALAVQLDAGKIQRVLINLLSNAFKFTPPGGQIRCSLRVESSGERVVVEIADSGRGIPLSERSRIFERYHQIAERGAPAVAGTGLGLAIARDFVTLHGGTISADDAPEGGALFRIELPLRAPAGTVVHGAPIDPAALRPEVAEVVKGIRETRRAAAPAAAPQPGEGVAASASPAGDPSERPRILVVEDHPDLNDFISEALRPDHAVRCAFDGVDGLAQAIEFNPTLIVSDVMMPGMTGEELVRELRRRPQFRDTPVVVLTARSDDDFRVRLLRDGAQDFLAKPFSVEELRARVGNLVKARLADERIRLLNSELVNGVARLESLSGQLTAANQELEAFSYAVSHDLHAPLRSINGFSQMLVEDHVAHIDAQGMDLLARIRRAAKNMQAMIDDLLQLSQATRTQIARVTVDVSALAADVIDGLASRQPERQVEVVIAPGMTASADHGLLRVVFENLLGNAWKFTGKAAHARIEVGWSQPAGGATIYHVRDNGAGFRMEHAAKLFTAFTRLHTQADFAGTGIGLATVNRVITRHGGTIRAESQPGQGATFSFTVQPS